MEEKSTNEKVGIFIIVFLVSLIIIIIILYLLGVFNRRPNEANIIVDDSVMFKYSKKKWTTVSSNSYSNYNWDKFKIYSNNTYIGTKSIFSTDGKWYVFEKNREAVNVPGDKLYLGGKIKTTHKSFNQTNVNATDWTYIHKVLDHYKISRDIQNDYTYAFKVNYDFDNDNKNEVMYIVSNLFADHDVSSSYSFIFINDNGNNKVIYGRIYGKGANLSGCYAYLYGIIEVEGAKGSQIITKCSHYSVGNNDEYGLYQFNNNKYQLLLYSK